MIWRDYKDQYGRCEVESAPFECKICGRVVKYDRNTVHTHLKNVHGINWAMYLDRIRRMRRGEIPEDLPAPETHECRVCNVSVKYLKEHLKNAHKITEQEYESLFEEEDRFEPPAMSNKMTANIIPRPPPLTPKPQLKMRPAETIPFVSTSSHDPTLPKPPKSDIQDKTNKTCSSCTITFDSRRSFIEHCTTVHNMRFKTKSGATISGNTVQKRLQEEAMRRKMQDEERMVSAQAYKRKAELDGVRSSNGKRTASEALDDGSTIVESTGKRTLYTPSGVSKWNQCKYECCFCKRTTMSRSSMTSHIHNTHGIPIKEYKESNYPDIEVETNWFQCRLCPARTKFVKDCIAPHLKMSHNMDIEVYERDIMQPEDWPYEVIPEPSLRHEMRNKKQSPQQPVQLQQPLRTPVRPQQPRHVGGSGGAGQEGGDTNSERDKWNRCKFACGLCELVTVDSRQMRLHIATHHGLSMDAYTKQYGTTEIVTKKFRCELCNSEMKFCRQNIYAHMKDVHKITLNDYEAQIGIQANEIVPVEDMGSNGQSLPRVRHTAASKRASAAAAAAVAAANDSNDDEIVLEGIDPTTVPVGQGDDYIDSGLLDDGKRPSRWNKCRFRCAICGKLSSEKRHVREHIIKFHGLSLPEYEGQYGDCEIHTEYFFCGVCHAEVKHNLKNISLHLQNVHAMTPTQYEMSYGMIPEDEDDEPLPNSNESESMDYGFGGGGHFLLVDDNSVETYDNPLEPASKQPLIVDAPKAKALPNPPRSDILNPKNKYCKPCNREFNRRQAFVEHCRTVHSMKIRFAKASSGATIINSKAFPQGSPVITPPQKITGSSATGYPCQYCGKLFSNQSNRRRHAVLSCELARNAGVEPRKSREAMASDKKSTSSKPEEDYYYEDGAPGSKVAETQVCPFPECEVTHMRSALMKRHLVEDHDVDEPEKKKAKIKTEPMDLLEIEHNDPLDDSAEDRKVPPLRVKISQVMSQKDLPAKAAKSHDLKPYVTCPICNDFKSNNLYILGRHQKSCEKKFEAKNALSKEDLNTTEEDEDDGDTTIEVPVDFEEQPEGDPNESHADPETSVEEPASETEIAKESIEDIVKEEHNTNEETVATHETTKEDPDINASNGSEEQN